MSQKLYDENLRFKEDALTEILAGVEILNNAVSPTIGPKGRCVLIENRDAYPTLTKDGVSIAKRVNLKDKFKRIGCDVVKSASEKTLSCVGDGTSTTILLSYIILKESIKLRNSGFSTTDLKKGIDQATEEIVENLKSLAKPLNDLKEIEQVATISANNDKEIGKLLTEAINHAGTDGIVMIDKSNSFKSFLETIEGMRFDRGYISPYFINNQNKGVSELKEPYIFISTKKLKFLEDVLPLLEKVARANKPILFIAEEAEGQFLHTLITNTLKGALQSCAILAPGLGEHKLHLLEDIATLTGGELITDGSGHSIQKLELSSLGKCEKILVGRYDTTIIGGKGNKEKINERIEAIRKQLLDPTLLEQDKAILKDRLAKLSGGISLVRVGGNTEAEMNERYDRVDDALHACQAGLAEGIVPGGGVALVRASQKIFIDPEGNRAIQAGREVVKNACLSLLKKIVENEGTLVPEVVLNKVLELPENEGFDAYSNSYVNMIEKGIIDPVLATRTALQNASSVASLLLVVDAIIAEDEKLPAQKDF